MQSTIKLSRRRLLMASGPFIAGFRFTGASARERRIKVLIVDGVSNHDWVLTTKLVRAILMQTGLFDVSVSTSPATADAPGWDLWRPDFKAHDAVI